jgi:uncharacterized protein YjbJ (UPF0337 family)
VDDPSDGHGSATTPERTPKGAQCVNAKRDVTVVACRGRLVGRSFGKGASVGPTEDLTKEREQMADDTAKSGAKGVVEDVKGKVKEVAGRVSDKEDLEAEGRAQQDKARHERDVAKHESKAEAARAEAKVDESRERMRQQEKD